MQDAAVENGQIVRVVGGEPRLNRAFSRTLQGALQPATVRPATAIDEVEDGAIVITNTQHCSPVDCAGLVARGCQVVVLVEHAESEQFEAFRNAGGVVHGGVYVRSLILELRAAFVR